MFLYISSIDENYSWYLEDNIQTYIAGDVDAESDTFVESNIMRG